MNGISAYTSTMASATSARTAKANEAKGTESKNSPSAEEKAPVNKGGFSDTAAVYEKSKEASDMEKNEKADRSALVDQLKKDLQQQKQALMDMVRETMGQQGIQIGVASEDDVWSFLAKGDFSNISDAAKAKAQEAISEDGYWGVEKTSDRILDFAKALSGDDPSKADSLLKAFKKGYAQATKSWGKELPDISKQTYEAVEKKFKDWKESANKTGASSNTTAEQAVAESAAATEMQA